MVVCKTNEDVRLEIIQNLNPSDILSLRKTCSTFYETTLLRSLWSNILLQFMQEQIPIKIPPWRSVDNMLLKDVEKVAVRTQCLQQTWSGPKPTAARCFQLPSRAASNPRGLLLRIIQDKFLLTAQDQDLEIWCLHTQKCLKAYRTPHKIGHLSAEAENESSILILLIMAPESSSSVLSWIHVMRFDFSSRPVTTLVWDENVPEAEFWGIGRPILNVDGFVVAVYTRPTTELESETVLIHFDRKAKCSRRIKLRGYTNSDVVCSISSTNLLVAGRKGVSSNAVTFELFDLVHHHPSPVPLATHEYALASTNPISIKLLATPPPIINPRRNDDVRFAVSFIPRSKSDQCIKIFDITYRENSATLHHSSERAVPVPDVISPLQHRRFGPPAADFLPSQCGRRALLALKARTGPGANTKDVFMACDFTSGVAVRPIALPDDLGASLKDTTSEVFDGSCGIIAWTRRDVESIHVVIFD